jgi:hypothetical protein
VSECLTRALFEHLVDNAYDTGNSQRIYDHDAALRSALLAAESRAERLEKVLREIDARTGHFGEAPPPPEWMPMLSLIAWVGRTARAALGGE